MIPSDIRLYTWVDVEEVLLRMQQWPEWLVWARAYWDELTMGIRPGTQVQAKDWLYQVYDPRFRINPEQEMVEGLIVLESLRNHERTLPVFFEETEEEPSTPRLTPSLSRPAVIWHPSEDIEYPDILPPDLPPVVAFHSFKGGVGRTTHALALAQALTSKNQKVLLVDGDMEAPGISWVFERRLPNSPVSFADLLALAHGDPSPEAVEAIQLVADRLLSSVTDGIFVLPSFRSNEKFSSIEIRPEHLIVGAKNPFIVTNLLANIGKALGVNVVIVDLRAGISELAAGLILDPRVYRIFVTTLSGQSISGTIRLLELLGEKSPSTRDTDPLPTLIITQVPENEQGSDLVLEADNKLLEASRKIIGEDRELLRVITPFADSLLVLPPAWEDVINRLQRSGIVDAVRPLVEWLPGEQAQKIATSLTDLKSQRQQLQDRAKQSVYAENAEVEEFLATNPLRKLASDNRHRLPIVVIVGAKGSGKTYTFLQIVYRENWQIFVRDAGVGEIESNAVICPLLESSNLQASAKKRVQEVRMQAAKVLGFGISENSVAIQDYIRDGCQLNLHAGQWRDRWLDVIALGIGFAPQNKDSKTETSKVEGAGRKLTEHLVKTKNQLIVVIDGLEDLFQNLAIEESQQIALRALLQDVPEWLGQQPGLPLGIIIFVRRDMVLATVRQNAAQMMARYEPYALKWDREEALRLVAWVANLATILPSINITQLHDMSEVELTEALIPLWGKRLGSERSKEAGSARFTLAALSDFRGQIQARDLVRLLHLAAQGSVNDTRFPDRILVPPAIKGALPECSHEKIQEIENENTSLKNVFAKLRDLPEANRKIPFIRDTIQLSLEEMKILEDNGVVIREKDEYYMPEIFRWGLGFSLTAAGRPKVIARARRPGQGG
ncbi:MULTISPECIES: KGGVGR-motif variant AAA ATPase [unclassified Microcoleus]|uniref:KGGVGR-motif variant AAA ATPase n=1 Tax=unclassified Microcoleus TaxID=2642155 RepID=UPI002FD44902